MEAASWAPPGQLSPVPGSSLDLVLVLGVQHRMLSEGWEGEELCRPQHGYLPSTVMASPSSLQPSSCSMLASSTARATCKITLMPS